MVSDAVLSDVKEQESPPENLSHWCLVPLTKVLSTAILFMCQSPFVTTPISLGTVVEDEQLNDPYQFR